MKITVVRPGELGPPELDRWRTLQHADPAMDDPFLSPEFTLAVGRVLDRARVAVVEDPTAGAVGFLPFERHPLGVGQPIGAELLGTQGMVHAAGLELSPRELLRGCGLTVWEFTDLLPSQKLFADHATSQAPCPVMDLSNGYEHWVAERKLHYKKLVRDLESKNRRMGRDLGDVQFTYEVTPDTDRGRADLRTLMRWKSEQYRRTGRSDRFAVDWIVRLIDELARTASPGCTGTLSMLYADGRPVAGHFGLASRGRLAHMFPAYDTSVRKYSPGLILNLRLAEAGAAAGLREISLGRGDFDYKQWFKSYDVQLAEGQVSRPSAGAAIRWLRREPVRRVTSVVVGNPRLRHAADQTLKRLGRLRTTLGGSAGRTADPGASVPGDTGNTGEDAVTAEAAATTTRRSR